MLNGKIKDTNSYEFTQKMFDLGVECKSVMVVPDEAEAIVQAVELMSKYDFVVTSGGIGPTHDDITYESLAKAFKLPMALHEDTVQKMALLGKSKHLEGPARDAQLRMATFPSGDLVSVLFLQQNLWVPVVGIQNKFYVLPGVPQLFRLLLDSLLVSLSDRIVRRSYIRYFVKTKLGESEMAPVLTKLQAKVGKDVKIGSYPHMGHGFNTVSILGPEKDQATLRNAVDECVQLLQGQVITDEQERGFSAKSVTSLN